MGNIFERKEGGFSFEYLRLVMPIECSSGMSSGQIELQLWRDFGLGDEILGHQHLRGSWTFVYKRGVMYIEKRGVN